MNDPLTEVMFWSQVIGDAKRTVICSPDLESRVKGWVEARGMGGVITVQAERFMPDDRIYVVNTPEIEAAQAEAMQHFRPTLLPTWPPVGRTFADDVTDPEFWRRINPA